MMLFAPNDPLQIVTNFKTLFSLFKTIIGNKSLIQLLFTYRIFWFQKMAFGCVKARDSKRSCDGSGCQLIFLRIHPTTFLGVQGV